MRIVQTLGTIAISTALAAAVQAQSESVLADVEAIIASVPVGARPGPDATRACFRAVDQLLEVEDSGAARLAGFLQDACYSGLRSQLEREGLYRFLSEMGHEVAPQSNMPDRPSLSEEIARCWNIGSLSREAQATTVVVAFSAAQDSRPIADTIEIVEFSGGSAEAAQQAFEAARRAILRCGVNGYQQIRGPGRFEMTFAGQGDPTAAAAPSND